MIGPYRVVEQVGRGGMATVYKAHHAALARYVAIKVLPEFLAGEEGFKERFQQEAVAVAKLRHPNILAVFDYGNADGTAYIVNEFVDGGTLSDQLGSPLPVDYVVSTLKPIASALDYAHARGILHRDIKPSNILMNMEGTPVLGDFGLAKMMERGQGLTQAGMIVGTPEYMSPEQCSGEGVASAADIYSLGVVAYQMLTGQLPFMAATPAAVINAQLHNQLPPPRSINPDLSPEVEGVLLKALAKAPKDRYRSAAAMVKALQEAGAAAAAPEHAPAAPPPARPEPTMVMGASPAVQPAPPPSAPAAPPAPPMTPVAPSAPPPPPMTPAPGPPPSQPPGQWVAQAQIVGGRPSTPAWVTVVLGVGIALAVVWMFGSFFGIKTAEPGTRVVLAFWGVVSLAVVALGVLGMIGIVRRTTWGRPVTWVTAILMLVTCVGLLTGIPLLVGLGTSRNSVKP
jgi:eukaryotic-like serine/threonine-protein kinase